MADYYVNSNAGALEYSNKVWALGELMVPTEADITTNHLVAKGWIWEVTTAATSSATPAWPAAVTDNTTTVTEAGGTVWTARNPDNWTHALPGLYWIGVSTSLALTSADVVYVAHTHTSKIYVNTNSLGFANAIVQCVTAGTTTPATGAVEKSNTSKNFSLYPVLISGITFTGGVGGTGASYITFTGAGSATANKTRVSNCTFNINNTYSGSACQFGAADTASTITFELDNNTFTFGAAGHRIYFIGASVKKLNNCSLSGTALTTALGFIGRGGSQVECYGCDFSNATNLVDVTLDDPWSLKMWNCKVPSTIAIGTHAGVGGGVIELHACSSADNNYDYYYQDGTGVVQDSTAIYLDSGAQIKNVDGTLVGYSLEANPSTAVSKAFPLYSPWFSVFNATTGSKTLSLKAAYDAATALTDAECWVEVEYYGDALTPMSTVEVSAPIVTGTLSRNILAAGTALTNTAAAWTGTSGWTNKKTATLSKTVTINQQGFVRARLAVAADVTVYVNPEVGIA